jgi:hyaluronan synthase
MKNRNIGIKILELVQNFGLFVFFIVLLFLLFLYKYYFIQNSSINFVIETYSILTGLFLFSRFILSYYYHDDHSKKFRSSDYPSISFVIACKNEEDSIAKTIRTCFDSSYPGVMDCVAIDDGSTDNTLIEMEKCKKIFGKKLKIVSFPKNLGKREGMASGVINSKNDIIIFVDSDSFVGKESVRHIVEHFINDSKVGAISGNTLVENSEVNLLTKMQSARYGVSYDVFKTSESVFGTVTCCPGCFSAYRREAILQVIDRWLHQKFLGTQSTFGDDRSLTNFVLRKWKVVYCRKAVATTIVPEKYKTFFKQQLRWKKSWVREGMNAGSFIWKKNLIASLSFYINLIIPVAGPFILIRVFLFDGIIKGHNPAFFIAGVVMMSLLFGVYYNFMCRNKNWWYIAFFTLMYTFILVWQMPYAILKIRDTRWGTR